MGTRQCGLAVALVIGALGWVGCRSSADSALPVKPAGRAAVEASVRQFTAAVAHDVTQEGPMAWQKYFASGPEFFMAVNGQLAFPNGQAAAQAIPVVAHNYKHIELRWGDDLRTDVLTENLCVVAASYTEVIELNPGAEGMMQGTQNGYFTGVAEKRNGQWRFRDAHWSLPVALAKSP